MQVKQYYGLQKLYVYERRISITTETKIGVLDLKNEMGGPLFAELLVIPGWNITVTNFE